MLSAAFMMGWRFIGWKTNKKLLCRLWACGGVFASLFLVFLIEFPETEHVLLREVSHFCPVYRTGAVIGQGKSEKFRGGVPVKRRLCVIADDLFAGNFSGVFRDDPSFAAKSRRIRVSGFRAKHTLSQIFPGFHGGDGSIGGCGNQLAQELGAAVPCGEYAGQGGVAVFSGGNIAVFQGKLPFKK